MTLAPSHLEATGVVADLFAQSVGFFASWGFSRLTHKISDSLLTHAGNIDWRSACALAETSMADVVGLPPDSSPNLPVGVYSLPPDLYGRVAVSQVHSGWGNVPGNGVQRCVLLRLLIGKERRGNQLRNVAHAQYRVWRRSNGGGPRRIFEASEALPYFDDVQIEIKKRLAEGE